MTPGMGFDVMVPGPGMQSPYMTPQHSRMGIGYMPMPATASRECSNANLVPFIWFPNILRYEIAIRLGTC